jgi:LysR family transcriptional regulator, regulator for metE and metH
MKLEIRHLKLIAAISEGQSVTRASEKLFLTQSALSHQLLDIESTLGTPLFHRLNKKMILTPAGERILQSAKRILAELEETEADLNRLATNKQGCLRISTACYTCYNWLPAILKDFRQKFPQLEVKIVVEATRKPIPVLLEGQLDIAITNKLEMDKRLVYEPIFEDEMLVIMSPDHPLATSTYIRPKDLSGQNYLTHTDLEESRIYQQMFKPNDVKFGNVSQVQLTEAIVEMVKADLGIAVLARWAVVQKYLEGGIVAKPLTRDGFFLQWYAVTLKSEAVPAYFGEFIKQISEKVSGAD